MYNASGDYQSALNDINSYNELKPYNADIWYEKGRALRNLNRLQESIPAFTRAIQLNKNKAVFYHERGRTYYNLGNINSAKPDISMAIQLGYDQVDPSIRSKLGL